MLVKESNQRRLNLSEKTLTPMQLEAKDFVKSFGTPLSTEQKKHGICPDCGLVKTLTEHHLTRNRKGPTVFICRSCHDIREGFKPSRSPEKQAERLLKRSLRFGERTLKLIRHDKRWVQIADTWNETEKKEMLEYLKEKKV